MRTAKTILVLTLVSLFLVTAIAEAKPGVCKNVLTGVPTAIEGIVTAVGTYTSQDGITIATENMGEVTVYGLGPVGYWNQQQVDRPKIGDEVFVEALIVDFDGIFRNIAASFTYLPDGPTIELRDAVTGCPLWTGR
jgi:hypothetical protein